MSTDPKAAPVEPTPPPPPKPDLADVRHQAIKIYSYPKIIYLWPTMAMALICGLVMWIDGDRLESPLVNQSIVTEPPNVTDLPAKEAKAKLKEVRQQDKKATAAVREQAREYRYMLTRNIMGQMFLLVFVLNLLVLAIDFPRFTVLALVFAVAMVLFFLMWLSHHFLVLRPISWMLEFFYTVANSGFYLMIAIAIAINLAVVYFTRFLDYWEVFPNEMLHKHGPLAEVERFATSGVKFDKEIPDIFEFLLCGAGRLVVHFPSQTRAVVLENVPFVSRLEERLNKVLSRVEVRITSDQETAQGHL